MPKVQRIGSLQVEQDLGFQRAEWRMERWGRVLMGLFLLCAAVGLLGYGFVGRARTSSASGSLVVEYDRFARRNSPSTLQIDAKGDPGADLAIQFSESLIQQLQIEQVTPEQIRTESSRQMTRYVFRTGDDGQARVRLAVQPQSAGTVRGQISIAGGETVTFWSFVYP